MEPGPRERLVRFERFELDPKTGELWKDGDPVSLPPRPAGLLALLVRNSGRIVSRERIRQELWGGTVIDFDQAINNAVRQVRQALVDDASDPRFVETVPRRGYRFIADLEPGGNPADSPRRIHPLEISSVSRGRIGVAAAVVLALVAATWSVLSLAPGARDSPDGRRVLALVPARTAVADSTSEFLADTLTRALDRALHELAPDRLRIIQWTWDLSYDPDAGSVTRDGEPVRVDFALEANVYAEEPPEVAVSLTNVLDGRQVWHRRFRELPTRTDEALRTVTLAVSSALGEGLLGEH